MTFDIQNLLRDNIRKLKPYSSARDEFSGEAAVFLDANENPFNAPYNRYPDPRQTELKNKIVPVKKVPAENIFLGNGSDEPIDLLIRAFCSPGKDNIVAIAPTYGMYRVAADVNDVRVIESPLNADYTLSPKPVLDTVTPDTKMIFLCSPNNPTGNALEKEAMLEILNNFNGLVIVDEAYIDFCPEKSLLPELPEHPNLVVLQTFSKAWGMAGIRLGMAFASQEIIDVLNRIKYPYNINILTQLKAIELIELEKEKSDWVKILVSEREKLAEKLREFPFVVKVYPSDANFLLIKTHDPRGIYDYLVEEKIIVRDRSGVALCEGSLRISVGSEMENQRLIEALEALV
ncbi:histidinol-phosphate transaminase [Prolixibacter denitrificans]|uniref:Histidinol-phosphate aminotransferase n=1 Tax=Prolixibacter denitrificans TaxID=1541063 RepID=A0A2P8CJS3_9BACT|nr:histidinol-phosphate transaminase [Prolixibacter denitrificans]PSK85220.1 histidinol-phosphate aminotransferase [Prolixibacter denitrificans]GET19842.1 histidinol-phosphate aminotransferase [Prolixibacter denitrificans]